MLQTQIFKCVEGVIGGYVDFTWSLVPQEVLEFECLNVPAKLNWISVSAATPENKEGVWFASLFDLLKSSFKTDEVLWNA